MFIQDQMINNAYDFIKESYTLLEESLKEILNTPSDIFSRQPTNDFLKALTNRIDYCRANYNLTDEDSDLLKTLENDITNSVYIAFCKEFGFDLEDFERVYSSEAEKNYIAQIIYSNFYLNRKELVSNFLVNYVFNKRKAYVANYRTNENRKDLEYYSMRKEFNFVNNDYHFIILNYIDILEDIINSDDAFTFNEFAGLSEFDVDQLEVIEGLFTDEGVSYVNIILESLRKSDYYNDMLIEIKNNLINSFSQTK